MYLRCDILGELPEVGTYDQVAGASVAMDVRGISCRVINLDSLVSLKRTLGRDKDLRAARELEVIRSILSKRKTDEAR